MDSISRSLITVELSNGEVVRDSVADLCKTPHQLHVLRGMLDPYPCLGHGSLELTAFEVIGGSLWNSYKALSGGYQAAAKLYQHIMYHPCNTGQPDSMDILLNHVVPEIFPDEGPLPDQIRDGQMIRKDVCALLTAYWEWRNGPEPRRLYLACCTVFENMYRARKRHVPTYYKGFGKPTTAIPYTESIVRPLPHAFMGLAYDGGAKTTTFTDQFQQKADYLTYGLFSTSNRAKKARSFAMPSPFLNRAQMLVTLMDSFYKWMDTVYDLSELMDTTLHVSSTQTDVHHFSRRKLGELFESTEYGKKAAKIYGAGRYAPGIVKRLLWYRLCGRHYFTKHRKLHLRLRQKFQVRIFERTGMLAELYEREKNEA
jgi:hypothetical protein